MTEFDLERALAGDKVVTRDGREVTQLALMDDAAEMCVAGVVSREIETFTEDGCNSGLGIGHKDLFMAPKKLSGFVNIDTDGFVDLHLTKDDADASENNDRIACIDLSQFEEGYGL